MNNTNDCKELDTSTPKDLVRFQPLYKPMSLEDLIPEDERAVEEEQLPSIAQAKAQGLFSPAAGMMQIPDELDGQIFAAIKVDAKGDRHIMFCQQYADGAFSPRIMVSQADLLLASRHKYLPANIPIPMLKQKLSRFITNVTEEYLGKIRGDIWLDIIDILSALCRTMGSLPVIVDNEGELTPEQFYQSVCDAFVGRTMLLGDHKAYYALTDEQIQFVADELAMSKKALLKKLVEYRFLYLPESAKGYQARVYIAPDVREWMYCILKIEYIVSRQSK